MYNYNNNNYSTNIIQVNIKQIKYLVFLNTI